MYLINGPSVLDCYPDTTEWETRKHVIRRPVMKIINFINTTADLDVKRKLMYAVSAGWAFEQACAYANKDGYVLARDQYEAINTLFKSQMEQDIGLYRNPNQ